MVAFDLDAHRSHSLSQGERRNGAGNFIAVRKELHIFQVHQVTASRRDLLGISTWICARLASISFRTKHKTFLLTQEEPYVIV